MIAGTNSILAWKSDFAVFFSFLNHFHKNAIIHKTLKTQDNLQTQNSLFGLFLQWREKL